MAKKWHIDINGKPAPCNADVRACYRGGQGEHFNTEKEAQVYADSLNASEMELETPDMEEKMKYWDITNYEQMEKSLPRETKKILDKFIKDYDIPKDCDVIVCNGNDSESVEQIFSEVTELSYADTYKDAFDDIEDFLYPIDPPDDLDYSGLEQDDSVYSYIRSNYDSSVIDEWYESRIDSMTTEKKAELINDYIDSTRNVNQKKIGEVMFSFDRDGTEAKVEQMRFKAREAIKNAEYENKLKDTIKKEKSLTIPEIAQGDKDINDYVEYIVDKKQIDPNSKIYVFDPEDDDVNVFYEMKRTGLSEKECKDKIKEQKKKWEAEEFKEHQEFKHPKKREYRGLSRWKYSNEFLKDVDYNKRFSIGSKYFIVEK